jgi:hypothetical protein
MDALANSEAQRRNLEPTVCVGTVDSCRVAAIVSSEYNLQREKMFVG